MLLLRLEISIRRYVPDKMIINIVELRFGDINIIIVVHELILNISIKRGFRTLDGNVRLKLLSTDSIDGTWFQRQVYRRRNLVQ